MIEAGKDPIRIIAANKKFWARRLSYIGNNRPLHEAFLFNRATRTSYHPWSAIVMGEAFGDSNLREIIPVKDYLDSPPLIDEFLEGMAIGMRKVEERKKQALKKAASENNGKNTAVAMVNDILNKGES